MDVPQNITGNNQKPTVMYYNRSMAFHNIISPKLTVRPGSEYYDASGQRMLDAMLKRKVFYPSIALHQACIAC